MRLVLLAVQALVLESACAQYEPRPLLPARTIETIENRRLTDTDVLERVQAVTGAPKGLPQEGAASEWNRAELFIAAMQLSPALGEARAQLARVGASMQTAGAIENPTLSLASEYDLSRAAEPTWLWGVSTSFLLDAFLSRNLRIRTAQAEVRGAHANYSEAIWAVRHDVRASLLGLALAERRIAALTAEQKQREDLLRLIRARVKEGEAARAEALQAELEQSRTRAALDEATQARTEARANLAAAIGVAVSALDAITPRWDDLEQLELPSSASFAELRERALLSRPDLERAIADYDARDLELQQQVRGQYLQFSLGPGYLWDHGIRKATLGASMSLPVFNRNQGPIAEAAAGREVAGQHALSVQARVLNEIESATQAYSSSLEALQRARERTTASRQLSNTTQRALQIGAEDRPTALAAELSASVETLAELDALERAQQALGRLEDALRAPILGPETKLRFPLAANGNEIAREIR